MLNYQGRKNLWYSAVKAVGTMVMNVIGKFSYIGLQENPREKKKKERKDSPSLLKAKHQVQDIRKLLVKILPSGYTYEPICLPKEAILLCVIA